MPDTAPTRLTLGKLRAHLEEECYRADGYHIGPDWERCGNVICIEQTRAGFEVFHVERGLRTRTIFIGRDESVACAKVLELLDEDYWSRAHCIAYTPHLREIEAAERLLETRSIRAERCDIPDFSWEVDVLYRLYVFGRDLPVVQQLIACGALAFPTSHEPPPPSNKG